MLRISLLGGFLIEHEGRNLPPISSTAGRSLLAYLITYRARRHTRDLLAGTFWPDFSESSARKRLSQALWQIHTALRAAEADESVIEVTPSQVAFTAPVGAYWLDVEEFERLANTGRGEKTESVSSIEVLERAVGLYRGDFLAGFYDDWMLLERQRLSDLYLHLLERLVTHHKARSDYRSALSWARRVVLEDPVRESAHREVMRLNFLLGQSTEALQQYERCVAILREELSVEPSTQTRRLRDEIVQLRDKGDRPFVPGLDAPLIGDPRKIPLIGRSDERTAVVRRIEDTLVGRGGVVLIEGESGIGKTRFLNELVKDAHWRGVNVLWAQGDQQTQLRPYHTMDEALRSGVTRLRARQLTEILDESLLAGITRVAPDIAGFFPTLPDGWDLPPDEARALIRESVKRALLALGELSAHVLFIDDAHWIDPESLDVLEDLLSDTSNIRLLIFLAYRSDEARDRGDLWQTLRRLDERSHPDRLALGRLGPEETSLLIDEVGGAVVNPSVAEGIYHETGGNPLFILETLRSLHETAEQVFGEDSSPQFHPQAEVASGVTRVIERRLSNLGARARVVLNAAAILGSRFDVNLLTRMSRLEASETLQELSQLVQRGVIAETGDSYEFSHQQMRIVAGELIRSSVRRRLHREAAIALEAEHPDRIEDLAHHYAAAGMAEPATRLAWQAGSRALTLASYESAARFLEQAVNWAAKASPSAADYFDLLCDFEGALDVLGERDKQIESIDLMDSVADHDAARVAESLRRRSNVLANLGDYAEALGTAAKALQNAEEADDEEVLSAVERTIGSIHSLAGSPAEAIPHLTRAATLIAGRSIEEADVRRTLGDVLADLQRYDQATEQLEIALSLYEESGNHRGMTDAKGLLGVLAMEQGQAPQAEDLYEQAFELARTIGYRRAEATNLGNLANLAYLDGRIGVALDRYVLAAEIFLSIGDRRGNALAKANSASVRHQIVGDDEKAELEAQSALEFFESESHDWGTAFCLETLGGIAARGGESDLARNLLERGLSLVENSQHRWLETHLLRDLAEIELDCGEIETSQDLVQRATELCNELGFPDVLPTVQGVASRVALAGGDPNEALRLARRATASLTETTERPYGIWYQRHRAESAAGNLEQSDSALAESWRLLEKTLQGVSSDATSKALPWIPIHRRIVEARRQKWPETVDARLPRADVPLGRKLDDEDMIDVHWTIGDPTDYEIPDRIKRRSRQVQRLISEAQACGASPRVSDLAQALKISEATLRRDLAALRRTGQQVATRGSQIE